MDIATDPTLDFRATEVLRMKETELRLNLLMRNTKLMECRHAETSGYDRDRCPCY